MNPIGRRTRVFLLLMAVASTPIMAQSVTVLSGPTLTMDPEASAPLTAVVEFTTDVPVAARLTISSGGETQIVQFPDASTDHYLPVLGLKPDRTYNVDVRITPGGLVGSLQATTGPLPADFPTLVTKVSNPGQMEPGYTLIDCMGRGPNPQGLLQYGAIVDSAGEVVWYTTRCFAAGKQLANGNILFRQGETAVEINLLSQVQSLITLQDPGAGLHHDLLRTPHGTYLSLSKQSVEVADFPTSDTDPLAPTATQLVRDEPVVEFFPDGSLRKEWSLLAMLDPTRIGYNSLQNSVDGLDSIHTNAVTYDPGDDSIVVSARHQDAVFKFSRGTGALQWILGNHENWSSGFQQYLLNPMNSPFEWQYHQHAPMWTGDGNLVLFDNGNHRASPFDGTTQLTSAENYSRAVEFAIDETNMLVEQVWEFGGSSVERIHSFFISDADWQPTTQNRLITFGGVVSVDGVLSVDLGFGAYHTRIIETTNDPVAVVVFDLEITSTNGDRMTVYRSERIPSLYPLQYFDPPNDVGATLQVERQSDSLSLTWGASPVDSEHDPAEYYMVYRASSSAANGFSILESGTATTLLAPNDPDSVVFYSIVAANVAGTSPNVPAP